MWKKSMLCNGVARRVKSGALAYMVHSLIMYVIEITPRQESLQSAACPIGDETDDLTAKHLAIAHNHSVRPWPTPSD